jgi:hypothetical protein
LYLALKPAESIFEGFTLLKSDFSQTNYTPKLVPLGRDSYCKVLRASQVDLSGFLNGEVGKRREIPGLALANGAGLYLSSWV